MTSEKYGQRPFALPADTTEVLLVRHGATIPAIPGEPFALKDGHGDPPLAPHGEAQAEAVARRLAAEDISAVHVTPLHRTHQTAAPLLAALGVSAIETADLREVHLGEWEGGQYRVHLAAGGPIVDQFFALERWDVIPGAEPAEDFTERTRRGLEAVAASVGPGKRAVAFVHGGVVGELCRQATGSRPFAFVHAENGSISRILRFADGRWLLRSFNDTSHLEA